MSTNGCDCILDCGTTTPASCECTDPGIDVSARHISSLDYKMCQRRLQNSAGVLNSRVNGSGAFSIIWTDEPYVLYPELQVGEDEQFTGLVAAVGSNGVHRRIVPTFEGFLRSDASGNFFVGDAPVATVPDPLTLTTLNASNATISTLTLSGTATLSALPSDTIVSSIGLNGANQLVKGSSPTISVALYSESTPITSASQPNATPIGYLVIGNEILDPDDIAEVQDSQTIKIKQTGSYLLNWGCQFGPRGVGGATLYYPGAYLEVNGSVVSYGNGRKGGGQNATTGFEHSGIHAMTLNANDLVKIKLSYTGATPAGNSGIYDTKVLLQKYN